MASRNGSASAGSCMAVTETSPSILDPMCGKMRGHSDMLHPHRIAVKLGRSKGMPLSGHDVELTEKPRKAFLLFLQPSAPTCCSVDGCEAANRSPSRFIRDCSWSLPVSAGP